MSLGGELDVAAGRGNVEFAFTVENASTEPIELSFRSGLVADFVVYGDGEEVWRWSDGRAFTQAIETETLAPGEAFTYTGTWEDPEPGEYEVVATLGTRNADVKARAVFEFTEKA